MLFCSCKVGTSKYVVYCVLTANVVGFRAKPSEDRTYFQNQVVRFDDILHNAGEAFDGATFTCPTTGLYLFSLTSKGRGGDDLYKLSIRFMVA